MTQKDIAQDLGISLITVQRALNDSGYVSAGLKKRILDYVKKKSYVPHRASQVLVRNTVRNIAVFSSSTPEYFWNDVGRGISLAADQIKPFNYQVKFHRVPDFDTEKYCALLKKEIRKGLSAAAFVSQGIFDMERIIGITEKAGVPYVMYNVDAPEAKRLCYIGSDYRAGGRLAANFIGKSLSLKKGGRVLIISTNPEKLRYAPKPDLNRERQEGFLEEMGKRYPQCRCDLVRLSENPKDPFEEKQIMDLLSKNQKKTDAVYFIPPFNPAFHKALERLDYRNTITVQHDLDDSAISCLNGDLLTAVVFQDPGLQGLMTVRYLEKMLETKTRERRENIEISHTLILRENISSIWNHNLLLDIESEVLP
jgi:LacI family transcriptional regulator